MCFPINMPKAIINLVNLDVLINSFIKRDFIDHTLYICYTAIHSLLIYFIILIYSWIGLEFKVSIQDVVGRLSSVRPYVRLPNNFSLSLTKLGNSHTSPINPLEKA